MDEEKVSLERIIEELEELSKPLDLDQLVGDGVLKRRARGWYQVLDGARLPKHAMRQVKQTKSHRDGRNVWLNFRTDREREKARKMLARHQRGKA